MYMSRVEAKVKNIVLYLVIAIAIALCVVCIRLATPSITARAEEDNYAFNLTEHSFVYDGNELALPLNVTKNGMEFRDYTITYLKDGVAVDEAKDVGNYVATVTINNVEPLKQTEVTFEITPKPLNIVVSGATTYQYSGMGYGRGVSPLGICTGDECEIITSYVGTHHELEAGVLPVHADSYDMSFATSNPNYTIGEVDGETTLVIQKRTLYVTVKDTSITYGETPEFSINIIGFVGEENVSVIERMPTVTTNAVEVGIHHVNANGGVAENYDFEYAYGNLTINGLKAMGAVEGTSVQFDVDGVFSPSTLYTGSVVEPQSEEGKELVKTARRYRMLNFTSKAALIYQLNTENGAQISDKVSVSFNNITSINANNNYFIVVIDPNGVVTKITKYEYMNGTLSFNAPSLGTVIVFEDSYNTTVLWIIVGVAVLFIIMLFVAERWQYRNAKRKADEDARKRRDARKNNGYEW